VNDHIRNELFVEDFHSPPTKADVIVVYYRTMAAKWPVCVDGLRENLDRINRIVVVNDEPWDSDTLDTLRGYAADLPITHWLDHPRPEGPWHGVGVSINQGMRLCTERYVLQTQAQQRLAPNYLQAHLRYAEPKTLLLAPVHQIHPWPDGPVVKSDFYLPLLEQSIALNRRWRTARNAATLVDREFHWQVGGQDEVYASLGYGNEDYDFGMRWLLAGGDIVWNLDTYSHAEFDPRPPRERTDKAVSPANWQRLILRGLEFYGGRLELFAVGLQERPMFFQVGHKRALDALADCYDLQWLPNESVAEVCYSDREPPLDHAVVAPQLHRILHSGGLATVHRPNTRDLGEIYAAAGFEVVVTPDRMDALKGAA
jgi:hypothetical protein